MENLFIVIKQILLFIYELFLNNKITKTIIIIALIIAIAIILVRIYSKTHPEKRNRFDE